MKYYVLCSSVTYAMKAGDAFNKKGLRASMGRARPEMASHCGCGYAVEVNAANSASLKTILNDVGVKPKRIYAEIENGHFMEVSL